MFLLLTCGAMFENKKLFAQSGCYAIVDTDLSSVDVSNPIKPFCPTEGFDVNAVLFHGECDADYVDIYVIFKADPKLPPNFSNYHTFTSFPDIYFSNIVSAAGAAMSPAEVLHNADDGLQKVFRYRVSLPGAGYTTFSIPFSFAPEWYFGDIPWDVHVLTNNSLDPAPLYPNFASDVTPAAKIGSLVFEAPYFPIVGSQNLSTIYTDLTAYILDPNSGKTHSILLLPGAGGRRRYSRWMYPGNSDLETRSLAGEKSRCARAQRYA